MQHKTMFFPFDNDNGFIQCVIKPEQWEAFESLGWVDNVERLKPVETKESKKKRKRRESQELLNLDNDNDNDH